jgi:hypothetical protein
MTDQTLYDTTAPSEGSVALAHQRILRLKQAGAFVNITGDINNLALNPTPITVAREVYGTKGRTSQDNTGYNFAPTFDVEVVRDPVTKQIVAGQSWVIDLVNAAYSEGGLNKRDFQIITDALDERFPAFEGRFSVAVTEGNTGYADKGILRFKIQNDGVVRRLAESPIAGDGTPMLESASPAGQAPGDLIVVRGYGLGSMTAATIDGQAVAEFRAVDDNTAVLLIPTTVSGSAPVIVTNGAGTSEPLPYTAPDQGRAGTSMTVTASKVGRDLHLTFQGVDGAFVIHPLPGRAGLQITDTYLKVSGGEARAEEMTAALQMAVDGARRNPDTGLWEPLPESEQTNFNRIGDELSQNEAESIIMPAFFWQTILGMDGVRTYLEGGEGLPGTLKATRALSRRLGLLVRPTSPKASATD